MVQTDGVRGEVYGVCLEAASRPRRRLRAHHQTIENRRLRISGSHRYYSEIVVIIVGLKTERLAAGNRADDGRCTGCDAIVL